MNNVYKIIVLEVGGEGIAATVVPAAAYLAQALTPAGRPHPGQEAAEEEQAS